MLIIRYAIVLQLIVMATPAFSAPVTHSTTNHKMSTVEAINACRAALGRHGKYLQVRKCVIQKRMTTIDAIKACRDELGKNAKHLRVRKCVMQKLNGP
jgi:hypothetical protein